MRAACFWIAMLAGLSGPGAMAQDAEMPELLGLLHNRYATPHRAGMAMAVGVALPTLLLALLARRGFKACAP